jgi:hypothetical protein
MTGFEERHQPLNLSNTNQDLKSDMKVVSGFRSEPSTEARESRSSLGSWRDARGQRCSGVGGTNHR